MESLKGPIKIKEKIRVLETKKKHKEKWNKTQRAFETRVPNHKQ